jgi:hypothetical protein
VDLRGNATARGALKIAIKAQGVATAGDVIAKDALKMTTKVQRAAAMAGDAPRTQEVATPPGNAIAWDASKKMIAKAHQDATMEEDAAHKARREAAIPGNETAWADSKTMIRADR